MANGDEEQRMAGGNYRPRTDREYETEKRIRDLELQAASRGEILLGIRDDVKEMKESQKASGTMVKSVLLTAAASIVVNIVVAALIFFVSKGGS